MAGVGLGIRMKDGILVVQYIVDGGPAAESSFFDIDDEIVAVDRYCLFLQILCLTRPESDCAFRRDVKSLPLTDVREMILGNEGTFVEIVIKKVSTQVSRNTCAFL